MILLDSSLYSFFGSSIFISICSIIVSIVSAYILIRERVLKSEMRIDAMTDYIDRKNDLINKNIENKNDLLKQTMFELKDDIQDFKQLNIKTSDTLNNNTIAIRELKAVLDLLKDQLGVKAINRLKKTSSD